MEKVASYKTTDELKADLFVVNAALEDQKNNHDHIGLVCVFCAQACNRPATPYYRWNDKHRENRVTSE